MSVLEKPLVKVRYAGKHWRQNDSVGEESEHADEATQGAIGSAPSQNTGMRTDTHSQCTADEAFIRYDCAEWGWFCTAQDKLSDWIELRVQKYVRTAEQREMLKCDLYSKPTHPRCGEVHWKRDNSFNLGRTIDAPQVSPAYAGSLAIDLDFALFDSCPFANNPQDALSRRIFLLADDCARKVSTLVK